MASECFERYRIRKPTAKRPLIKAKRFETTNVPACAARYSGSPTNTFNVTPTMIGSEARKLYSAAAAGFKPIKRPARIVEPEREVPGISAIVWARPITKARCHGSFSPSLTGLSFGNFSTTTIKTPTIARVNTTTTALAKKAFEPIKSESIKPTTPAGTAVIIMFRARR